MSRKLTAAALALSVVGGVYLSAGQAHASNMGFKLERNFGVIRQVDADPATPFLNIYLLSFPVFNGLGDVASDGGTGHPTPKGCVGDTGGPGTGDGVINSMDALCDLWTDRATRGAFVFSRFDRDTCSYIGTSGNRTAISITFGGTVFDLERDAGFIITVSSPVAAAPGNRAVVVGSHDPSYTGRQIRSPASACAPANDFINLPYHSMYQKASEVLCGLEGVDWTRVSANVPSQCQRGIFDDAVSKRPISVLTFDNVKDSNGTDNQYVGRSIAFNALTGYRFSGTDFDLTPGDAYIVSITPGHQPTTFLSPHF